MACEWILRHRWPSKENKELDKGIAGDWCMGWFQRLSNFSPRMTQIWKQCAARCPSPARRKFNRKFPYNQIKYRRVSIRHYQLMALCFHSPCWTLFNVIIFRSTHLSEQFVGQLITGIFQRRQFWTLTTLLRLWRLTPLPLYVDENCECPLIRSSTLLDLDT